MMKERTAPEAKKDFAKAVKVTLAREIMLNMVHGQLDLGEHRDIANIATMACFLAKRFMTECEQFDREGEA